MGEFSVVASVTLCIAAPASSNVCLSLGIRVSGHDFIRAVERPTKNWALQAAEKLLFCIRARLKSCPDTKPKHIHSKELLSSRCLPQAPLHSSRVSRAG